MEEHTTPAAEHCADLNQNSATLHGGKAEIVGPNENGVLSNGVHAEDNENGHSLSELDQQKQIPDSPAEMTTSTSQDTGFGSASVSEVSSPVENSEGIGGRVENLPAEDETVGGTYGDDVLGDATDNDENTLNSEASFENIVETAPTEDVVNNDVEIGGEDNDKIEKPLGLEVENTNVGIKVSSNEEEDIAEKASDEAENNHDKLVSNIVDEDAVKEVADQNTEAAYKLVDSVNVGSTDRTESENENVDNTASDARIDRNIDDATNKHLEAEEYKEINVNNVEQSEVDFKNTDDVVEIIGENVKDQTNEIEKKDDYGTLKEPEAEEASVRDTENKNIENVTADTASSVESKPEEYEAKSEETAVGEQQHTVSDVSGEVEQATGSEDQKVNDDFPEAADNKTDDADTVSDEDSGVMDILGNGLLKKKVLVPGKGVHTRPNNGDIVTVSVDGLLPDGTHVDTGEITFALNDGDVILAFDLAVALMEEGEKCELFTSERYAYGSLGREPDIPKDTSITYTLELVKVEPPPAVIDMNYDQRLKLGEAKRERGNYLFGRTDYSGAINSYTRAVKLLDNPELNEGVDESSRSVLTESWVKCYNNLAACQLKIDAVDAAIKSCEKVLSVQKDNVKALFRLGKAYGIKGEVDVAISYLRRAIKLEPESKIMQQEMLNLTRRKSKETATEKELYQRMFGVRPGDKFLADENKKANSNKLVKWTLVAGGLAAVLISVGLTWYRAS